jgi:hypothetical protein
MISDQADLVSDVRARQSTASEPASDLPTSTRQLVLSLAHLILVGSVLWGVAAAASLAQSF